MSVDEFCNDELSLNAI